MPIALTFRDAMLRLSELSGPEFPPQIQVAAVCKIVSILSPSNPHIAEVMRALLPDDEEASGNADDDPL